MVGMVGVLPDVERRAAAGLRRDGDVLLLIGAGEPGIGASTYLWRVHGIEAGAPPELDLGAAAALVATLAGLVRDGVVDTAHDLAEGGWRSRSRRWRCSAARRRRPRPALARAALGRLPLRRGRRVGAGRRPEPSARPGSRPRR
jgi:hypothetical protein